MNSTTATAQSVSTHVFANGYAFGNETSTRCTPWVDGDQYHYESIRTRVTDTYGEVNWRDEQGTSRYTGDPELRNDGAVGSTSPSGMRAVTVGGRPWSTYLQPETPTVATLVDMLKPTASPDWIRPDTDGRDNYRRGPDECWADMSPVEKELTFAWTLSQLMERHDQLTDANRAIEHNQGLLERTNRNYSDVQGQLQTSRSQHAADIETISTRFIEEANRRNWCSEYDTIVSDLNSELNIEMETREAEYDVIYTVRVTVTANSDDQARERVDNEISRFTRNSNYSYDVDCESVDRSED